MRSQNTDCRQSVSFATVSVEVVACRALVVLLDDADDNGAVLLRGFVYDLMLRMIALERLLVMLDFFAHLPRRDAVRKAVLFYKNSSKFSKTVFHKIRRGGDCGKCAEQKKNATSGRAFAPPRRVS